MTSTTYNTATAQYHFFDSLADAYENNSVINNLTSLKKRYHFIACILRDWLNDINISSDGLDENEWKSMTDTEEQYRDFLYATMLNNTEITSKINRFYTHVMTGEINDDYGLKTIPTDELTDISADIYFNQLCPLF